MINYSKEKYQLIINFLYKKKKKKQNQTANLITKISIIIYLNLLKKKGSPKR